MRPVTWQLIVKVGALTTALAIASNDDASRFWGLVLTACVVLFVGLKDATP